MTSKRVLIFDSGVGGLSVFQQIIKINPTILCHYLFDNAFFPYGELEDKQLIKRLSMLLTQFISRHPVDLIVIACNSASTVALETLRGLLDVPIVGVVPAIKPASALSQNGVIGLLATPATIKRSYTDELINEFAADKQVLRIGSTELVQFAEDKLAGKTVNSSQIEQVLLPWIEAQQDKPDTIVLGCTHFPLLKEEIRACFKQPINLVDSGMAIALRVKQLLKQLDCEVSTKSALSAGYAFYTQAFPKQQLTNIKQCFVEFGFTDADLFSVIN